LSASNKASARAAFEVWSTGELERLDDLVAPDVVHHDRYDPHGDHGLEGMKRSGRAEPLPRLGRWPRIEEFRW
jgi:ketosteroid isomerase-like protein